MPSNYRHYRTSFICAFFKSICFFTLQASNVTAVARFAGGRSDPWGPQHVPPRPVSPWPPPRAPSGSPAAHISPATAPHRKWQWGWGRRHFVRLYQQVVGAVPQFGRVLRAHVLLPDQQGVRGGLLRWVPQRLLFVGAAASPHGHIRHPAAAVDRARAVRAPASTGGEGLLFQPSCRAVCPTQVGQVAQKRVAAHQARQQRRPRLQSSSKSGNNESNSGFLSGVFSAQLVSRVSEILGFCKFTMGSFRLEFFF